MGFRFVSLIMRNSVLPAADGLRRDADAIGKLLLRQSHDVAMLADVFSQIQIHVVNPPCFLPANTVYHILFSVATSHLLRMILQK